MPQNKFLEQYWNFCNNVTDAPPVFYHAASILVASQAIQRRRWIQWGSTKIYPNLYLCLVGPTKIVRKSTVLDIAQNFVTALNENYVLPVEFSYEQVLTVLSKQSQGTFFYDEFKVLNSLLGRDYMASMESFLTYIFSCPRYHKTERKKESFLISEPCLSILTATTPEWFLESLTENKIRGGFTNRFVFIYASIKSRTDVIPNEIEITQEKNINKSLAEIAQCPDGRMILSPEAKTIFSEWYINFEKRYEKLDPIFKEMYARLDIYALKFSIVLQTCEDQKLVITKKTMIESIQFCDWIINSTEKLCEDELSFSKMEKYEKRVLRCFNGTNKISRRNLLRMTHLSSKIFTDVAQTLIEKERISYSLEKLESQRPTTLYSLVQAEKSEQ